MEKWIVNEPEPYASCRASLVALAEAEYSRMLEEAMPQIRQISKETHVSERKVIEFWESLNCPYLGYKENYIRLYNRISDWIFSELEEIGRAHV